jgi:hypothetical protein
MTRSAIIAALTLTTLLACADKELPPTPVETVPLQCIQLSNGNYVKGSTVTRSYQNIALVGISVPQTSVVPGTSSAPFEVFAMTDRTVAYHNGTWYTQIKQSCNGKDAFVWECTADPFYQDKACGSLVPKPQ